MLQAFFHAWERGSRGRPTIASCARSTGGSMDSAERITLDRSPGGGHASWVSSVMADTDAFFTPPPTTDYRCPGGD